MKYSKASLDKSIKFLIPKVVQDDEVLIRTKMLSIIAIKYFNDSFDSMFNPSFDERMAYYICQEASIELEKDGFIKFGTREIDFS